MSMKQFWSWIICPFAWLMFILLILAELAVRARTELSPILEIVFGPTIYYP